MSNIFDKLYERKLRPDEIEIRLKRHVACDVKTFDLDGEIIKLYGFRIIPYLKTQTVRNILNETFGIENWQCSDYEVKGKDFCTISIRNPQTGEWISKSGCGSPDNNFETEKAEASDAFKRAAQHWNIGAELLNDNKFYNQFIFQLEKHFFDIKKGKNEKGENYEYIYLKDKYGLEVAAISTDDNKVIQSLEVILYDKTEPYEHRGIYKRFFWTKRNEARVENPGNSRKAGTGDIKVQENTETVTDPLLEKRKKFREDMSNWGTDWNGLFEHYKVSSIDELTEEQMKEAYEMKKRSFEKALKKQTENQSTTGATDKKTKPDALSSIADAQGKKSGADSWLDSQTA